MLFDRYQFKKIRLTGIKKMNPSRLMTQIQLRKVEGNIR